jgi:hypothetical protein
MQILEISNLAKTALRKTTCFLMPDGWLTSAAVDPLRLHRPPV